MQWLYFCFVQLCSLVGFLIGTVLLAVPCALRSWERVEQPYQPDWAIKAELPKKQIYVWKWLWLNKVWGNDEDGVTGASFYNSDTAPSRWHAYLWSAWRNSCNNLRFVFRNSSGPFIRFERYGYYVQAGWYPNGFPVLSAGKING